jgi:pimeloyl-ACP methyl ester carboxylesterase
MSPRSFSIEIGDATIVGERRDGNGTPLVLIHGFGGSRRDWDCVTAALPADIPLITYDQRGFGDSDAPAGIPFSHSEDLLALLDAMDVAGADVCGMSLGGATALGFGLDHPSRVERLVLVSPLISGWSWSDEWIRRWKQISRAARTGDMDGARELWWRHPLFDSTRCSEAADALRASINAFHGRQWVQDDQRPQLSDLDRLTELAVPTLLLTGALDTQDFRLIAQVLEATAPHLTRIDYPEAGHMLNLEVPGMIAPDIRRFLAS